MKKHDEGYVMLLVVVVILVLSIVSAALMSMTVANLKNQRNSVNRMQEKYSAQGELEKEIANLQSNIPMGVKNIEIPTPNTQPAERLPAAVGIWLEGVKEETGLEDDRIFDLSLLKEEGTFSCMIRLDSETTGAQISCEMKLIGTVEVDEKDPDLLPPEEEDTGRDGKVIYKIECKGLTYTSYEIIEKEVAANDEAQ